MPDIRSVTDAVNETQEQLSRVRSAINQASTVYEMDAASEQNTEFVEAQETLRAIKSDYSKRAQDHGSLELEVGDSSDFIVNLERRATALEESLAADEALGRLALRICPECLQPLDEHPPDGHC